ncbi:MAG: LTA synthase family protein [Ruminococcaceae bacterium]|nr:LTA synthase family protein [Oscillospiraceae bacterium]
MSVVGDYKFEFTERVVRLIIGFVIMTLAALLLCRAKVKIKAHLGVKIAVRLACVALCVPMLTLYTHKASDEDFQSRVRYYPYLFTPTVVYRDNGFYFSFMSLLQYINIDEPKGYDADKLEAAAKDITDGADSTVSSDVENPNVIIIMNESFSDLSVLGDTGYSPDYMPFIDSLTENTIKGETYVSVKGGNTPNSEWEFLTGNTMAFLPSGSIPYQQYITTETENFISTLKNKGYKTYGIHPYPASGWDRDAVYPLLGIDEFITSSSFYSTDKIRNYISDEAVYDKVIRLYHENKANDDPLAFFCVTMQNHGGYTNFREFEEFEYLADEVDELPSGLSSSSKFAIAGYTALIKESDRAFGDLVEFFEREKEPTVIIMFGDHQPNSTITKPILKLLGIDEETEDWNERSNQFRVPFVIWANYDIEEQQGVVTSLNYLNILLSEASGFELTGYQTFRKELQAKYPVITANFCIDSNGMLRTWKELDMDADGDLLLYKQLQYNHTFDTKNTVKKFFE